MSRSVESTSGARAELRKTLKQADEFLRGLLLEGATVKELPVGRILRYAFDEGARIIVDPFMACGRKYSCDELRS